MSSASTTASSSCILPSSFVVLRTNQLPDQQGLAACCPAKTLADLTPQLSWTCVALAASVIGAAPNKRLTISDLGQVIGRLLPFGTDFAEHFGCGRLHDFLKDNTHFAVDGYGAKNNKVPWSEGPCDYVLQSRCCCHCTPPTICCCADCKREICRRHYVTHSSNDEVLLQADSAQQLPNLPICSCCAAAGALTLLPLHAFDY